MPYLGICLGMQLAVVEFARNVVGLADANSTEFESVSGGLQLQTYFRFSCCRCAEDAKGCSRLQLTRQSGAALP